MRPDIYNKYITRLLNSPATDPTAAKGLITLLDEYSKHAWLSNRHHRDTCQSLSDTIKSLIESDAVNMPDPTRCIELINETLAKDKQEKNCAINPRGDLAHLLAIWFNKYKCNPTQLNERFQPAELAELINSIEEMPNHTNTGSSESKTVPIDENNSQRRPTRGASADDIISLGILTDKSAAALKAAERRELELAAEACELVQGIEQQSK